MAHPPYKISRESYEKTHPKIERLKEQIAPDTILAAADAAMTVANEAVAQGKPYVLIPHEMLGLCAIGAGLYLDSIVEVEG